MGQVGRDLLELVTDGTAAWQRFRAGLALPGPLAGVRARWERSQQLGADPDRPEDAVVTAGELAARAERLRPLLAAVPDVLDAAARAFADRDFTLLLADEDGVVVRALAGGGFAEEASRVRLIAGSSWSEQVRGTNAIGTALTEARPVAVRGAAHWARPNHRLACWATPVRDPLGRVLGVLDATSFHTAEADPVVPVTLLAAARAIEAELRRRGTGGPTDDLLRRVLAAHPGPALAVTRAGGVQLNDVAARALDGDAHGIGFDWSQIAPWLGRRQLLASGPWAGWRASFEPAETWQGEVVSALILIDRPHTPVGRAAPADGTEVSDRTPAFAALHGSDPRLREAIRLASRLAPSPLPLLVLAETGTGKELLARAIHAASRRANGPWVVVNCGSLSESLLESELFGYAPGAFTGAAPKGRDGLLAAADGGTLFLDEVAEMPPRLQALLLRFLEDGTYHRLGDPRPRKADVRLVSATCRELEAQVRAGAFRQDLFFRLRGGVIALPPLRARADLPELADHLLARLAAEQGVEAPTLDDDALASLRAHSWPGNVRELRMTLLHALAMCDGHRRLGVADLPAALVGAVGAVRGVDDGAPDGPRALEGLAVDAVRRALATCASKADAAKALGIARSTLYRMIERYGL